MIPMQEQWFRLYRYVDWSTDPKTNERIPPKWEPIPGEPLHTHHLDASDTDPRIRIEHHRKARRTRIAVTACLREHDPEARFVEEHDPNDRCPKCLDAIRERTTDAVAAAEVVAPA